jgi:hypothetical protein
MAYVGDTRSRKLLAKLERHGIGQIIIRGKLRGRRLARWAYDNGAFVDWKANREFDGAQFLLDVATFNEEPRPDFLVLPDRVGGGLSSLALSCSWLERLSRVGIPRYLAVQDGQTPKDLPWGLFDGVFIGGTLEWKVRTAAEWVRAAHDHRIPCHYGRCGTARRIAHAKSIGADSLDSSLPLWSTGNLNKFLTALAQRQMFDEPSLVELLKESA